MIKSAGVGLRAGHAALGRSWRAAGDRNPLGHHVTNSFVTADRDHEVVVRSLQAVAHSWPLSQLGSTTGAPS
jgi:hypothetical protein